MAGVKLSISAASISANPYKWFVRTITFPEPTVSFSRDLPLLSTVDDNWRRLGACALSTFPVHVRRHAHFDAKFRLGFPVRGRLHACFYSASFSGQRVGISPGSCRVADMGQDEGVTADHNGYRHHDDDRSLLRQDQTSSNPRQQQPSSKLLTLPTVLTLGRVAAVPLLVATFYIDSCWGRTATTSTFIAAAITDWLDGYIARKMRLGSAFGAFLDPVADKLMVAATLILLCTKPLEVAMFRPVPWLLTIPSIAIIGREITMSAVREWAASQNGKLSEAVAVNNLGKWKTATQMMSLTILLATRDWSVGGLVASGIVLLYVSPGLSVWSLAVYMGKIWKVLMK